MYQYLPEIPNDITSIDFNAYMVESAYKYYMTAIKSSYDDFGTKSVICSLVIEITLTSIIQKQQKMKVELMKLTLLKNGEISN